MKSSSDEVKRGFLNRDRQIGLIAAKSMMGKSAERGKCPVPIKSYRKKAEWQPATVTPTTSKIAATTNLIVTLSVSAISRLSTTGGLSLASISCGQN